MAALEAPRASKRRRGAAGSGLGSPDIESSLAEPSSTNQSSRRTSASTSASPALSPASSRGNTYGTRSRRGAQHLGAHFGTNALPNRPDLVAETGPSTSGLAASSPLKLRAGSPAGTQISAASTREKSARVKERQRIASAGGTSLSNGPNEDVAGGSGPNLSAEDEARQAQEQKDAEEMWQRWSEEYFEIVEQLPLELHRSFALMRELESKLQSRIKSTATNAQSYRDARLALRTQRQRLTDSGGLDNGKRKALDPDTTGPDRLTSDEPQLATSSDGSVLVAAPSSSPAEARGDVESDDGDVTITGAKSATAERKTITSPIANIPVSRVPSKAARMALLRAISHSVSEGIRAAEEKVGLAVTAYDWVDRHIRRLDADLQKSENSLLLGLRAGTEASRGLREALGMDEFEEQEAKRRDALAEDDNSTAAGTPVAAFFDFSSARGRPARGGVTSGRGSFARGGRRGRTDSLSPAAAMSLNSSLAPAKTRGVGRGGRGAGRGWRGGMRGTWSTFASQRSGQQSPTETLQSLGSPSSSDLKGLSSALTARAGNSNLIPDMAIDPNEPRYCYCDQVSYGDMVACDNDDCPREWFHYSCVGLDSAPRSKWYCLFCAPANWPGRKNAKVPPNAPCPPPGHTSR
ncbi:chromatin remodeling protein [Ceraceosorus bombacis]|uniref:Chromatin modification-related protein n=1 Tax=Ceraceosorus bombacis TaxID=401625 RepID=A0A0P1BFG0_9BASI|nr:chromatin remodeling protein [Ceraceosorus bombacis]